MIQKKIVQTKVAGAAGSGVIQETRKGIGIGASVGGAVGGFLGSWGGPIGIGIGITVGGAIGGYFGNRISEGGERQLQDSYATPNYSSPQGQRDFVLPSGTPLFHGTRWSGGPKWWESGLPNKQGEDGGISFALNPNATPKIKNAQYILEYKLRRDVRVTGCPSKGDFHAILSRNRQAVCYTPHETELVFHPSNLANCVEFVYAHERPKNQLLEVVVK